MNERQEKFLPGPNCRDDDVCFLTKECLEAKRIRAEAVKQTSTGSSLIELEVQKSACQSQDAIGARNEGKRIIRGQYGWIHS